jgi:hypothetical protein
MARTLAMSNRHRIFKIQSICARGIMRTPVVATPVNAQQRVTELSAQMPSRFDKLSVKIPSFAM